MSKTTIEETKNRFRLIFTLAREAYGPYKKQILALTGLGFVGGLLEGIGVNALIPLLSFVISGEARGEDFISQMIEQAFLFLHVEFTVRHLLAFIVILFIIRAVVMLLVEYVRIHITTRYEETTRNKLLSAVLGSDWPHLLKQRLGHLETVVIVDVPYGASMLQQMSASIMIATGLAIYITVAFNISPLVTLSTLVLGGFVFLLFKRVVYKTRVFAGKQVLTNREALHLVGESISGVKTIKALQAGREVMEKGRNLFALLRDYTIKMALLRHFSLHSIQLIGILYIALVFGLSFRYGLIQLAALAPIIYLIHRMFVYIQQIQAALHSINESVPHVKSILEYEKSAVAREEEDLGEREFSFKKELAFKDVVFSYPGQREGIRDITFSVKKGTMLGVIGPSGAGKTTLVDILLRLLTPTKGSITLDGVDIKDVDMHAWRKNVGYVSQDLFLLNDTIANNIRFFESSISDEGMREAARMANVLDVIESTPDGFDTIIGERGVQLSAGQRQRVVIARILARQPLILILDEATSALDAESEAKIHEVIKGLKGKLTVIAVAHRLSTVMDSDELLVLKDGTVAEKGSAASLLKDKESYFYKVNDILS